MTQCTNNYNVAGPHKKHQQRGFQNETKILHKTGKNVMRMCQRVRIVHILKGVGFPLLNDHTVYVQVNDYTILLQLLLKVKVLQLFFIFTL